MTSRALVLFDIDGTLVRRAGLRDYFLFGAFGEMARTRGDRTAPVSLIADFRT